METATQQAMPVKYISRKDEITAQFLDLLESHVNELVAGVVQKRLAPSEFGKRLFIHPRHLTTTIKLTTGKSPCDFMEERIILESQKFLRETDMSIADIGYRLGYTDASNFTKFYKGMTGHTPKEFRKQIESTSKRH